MDACLTWSLGLFCIGVFVVMLGITMLTVFINMIVKWSNHNNDNQG